MNSTGALIVALLIAGCGTTKPAVRFQPVEVKVPVAVACPAPPAVARPALLMYELTEQDNKDPGKVSLIYQATVKQLLGYSVQLETILDGYRNKLKDVPNESK